MAEIYMDVDVALAKVPVNLLPLIDDTDFKTREVAITYDQAGMDLVWNFVTTAGVMTQTAVVPTTGGVYDWTNLGDGMYSIEIPASGGVSINNDTEGYGWFTGYCTGVLPWRGPVICLRAAAINNALIDSDTWVAGVAQTGADADTLETLSDQIDNIQAEVNGLNGEAMRGTDSAALASVCTETRLAELDPANLPADIAAIPTGTAIADAVLDEVVEGSYTLRQLTRGLISVLAGKTSGGGTATLIFRDTADSKNRITATVDENKNRTAITLDLT